MRHIYRVQNLPKEELNGREVMLNTLHRDHPNLLYLRSESINK